VDDALGARLRELALAAYGAIDARGMARVDFLSSGEVLAISEMNTIPGFTATSMFPKQAELAGISFTELVSRLLDLAIGEGPA
jgi:D-alanine-D-alanine ligase